MDFNKDGTHFATVGKEPTVRVYDEETNAIAHNLGSVGWKVFFLNKILKDVGHNNRVFCVKFIPEEPNLLITGGWDCNVIFWDIRENKSIRSFMFPYFNFSNLFLKIFMIKKIPLLGLEVFLSLLD